MNYKDIIDNLIDANNCTEDNSQKNLFNKEDYETLLNDVLDVLKANKDLSLEELREKLYEKSNLEEIIRDFFINVKKAPGAVISFGTNNYQEKIIVGNRQEIDFNENKIIDNYVLKMEEDTIFDLASVTKLFTSVAILQLAGNGDLKLNDSIKKYLPMFNNLGNHTIFDLLTFQPYHTEKRIDSVKTKEEAESILFDARPYSIRELIGRDRYNDIAPMILKYIVEEVTQEPFEKYVYENILLKGNMKSTYVKVDDDKLDRIANNNFIYKIGNDGVLYVNSSINKGVASDAKAAILGQPNGNLSGHAGLFSTCDDLVSFSKGLIDGTILHPDLTIEMSKNRTLGQIAYYGNIEYPQYYGFLCHSKHPNELFSEVYQGLSGRALSQQGWTGTQVTIDPINKINLVFLSNRIHNRIVENKKKERKTFLIDSSRYAFEKNKVTNACLKLALEEKILEDIIGKDIEKERVIKKVKTITSK